MQFAIEKDTAEAALQTEHKNALKLEKQRPYKFPL